MTKIGYTRVSTTDQNTDRQELGDITRLFEDKASGGNAERPALQEMLAYIREGDEVVVFSIDRLARNLRDLEDIIKDVNRKGVSVTFSEPLDPASITPKALKIKSWDYIRSKNYGSKHLNEKSHSVTATSLSPDGKTLTFQIAELSTCWQMSIKYELQAKDGSPVRGEIQNTIHTLRP